jgi:hypothetical protein
MSGPPRPPNECRGAAALQDCTNVGVPEGLEGLEDLEGESVVRGPGPEARRLL